MSTHANRVKMTVTSVASAGTGDITLNAASSGFRSFATAYGANATVDILITEGTAWEIARNCTYTHSGTTVSRGTLENSSTGSAVVFTSAAVVSVIATASFGNNLELQLARGFTYITNNGSTTQSLTADTNNKISTAFTTVNDNPYTWWDTTNKQFLPTRAGSFLIVALIQTSNATAMSLQVNVYKNNAAEAAGGVSYAPAYTAASIAAIVSFNGSSDYIDIRAYPFGASPATNAAAASVFFKAIYLGP